MRFGGGVEDHLLARRRIGVLVNVDERLMDRIVGKEIRVDGQCARMLIGNAVHQPQRELLFHRQNRSPFDFEWAIGAERDAWREHIEDLLALARQELRIEHGLRRGDVELVRNVDDMNGERTFDIAAAEGDVEITERRRVGPGTARAQNNGRKDRRAKLSGDHRADCTGLPAEPLCEPTPSAPIELLEPPAPPGFLKHCHPP